MQNPSPAKKGLHRKRTRAAGAEDSVEAGVIFAAKTQHPNTRPRQVMFPRQVLASSSWQEEDEHHSQGSRGHVVFPLFFIRVLVLRIMFIHSVLLPYQS